jgi:hypothetical protein
MPDMADGRSQWEREQQRLAREVERQQRLQERAQIAAEKEQQRQHIAARKTAAEQKTAQLAETVEKLGTILRAGLTRPGRFDITDLYQQPRIPQLRLGNLAFPVPEPEFIAQVNQACFQGCLVARHATKEN